MKKILITGADGMVGSRFVDLYTDDFEFLLPSEKDLDITDKNALKKYVHDHDLDVIINFAAYTNVNEAEKQRGDRQDICWKVNVEGVRNLIDSIDKSDIHFIQISTDMVFSGAEENPGPYSENAKSEIDLNKLTWYGITKLLADQYVMEQSDNSHSIVRIIYPVRVHFEAKNDYLRGPLELYDQGKLYPLIRDQQVSISFIDEIAEVLAKITNEKNSGTYHVSSIDTGTPFEIVSYLLQKSRGIDPEELKTTSLDEFLQKTGQPKYRYPKFGGLEVEKTQKRLDMQFHTWQQIIDELLIQGLGK